MNKKQRDKERRINKNKEKQERENIINFYIDKIKALIDEGYIEMAVVIEEFNNGLLQSAMDYNTIKQEMETALRLDDGYVKFEELTERAIEIEKKNDDLYMTIISNDINKNKILKELAKTSKKVAMIVSNANDDLRGKKNDAYIVSILINRSCKEFDQYNRYIMDIALESNQYIDAYINAREDFIDFIKELKELTDEKFDKHIIEEVDENIKYKERLRISYYEMESFLKFKGYESIRQGNTTHAIWRHKETGVSIPVPNKSRTMPQGTVSKILRMIESNRQELAQFLYQ